MTRATRPLIADGLAGILAEGQTLDGVLRETRTQARSIAEAAYVQECLYGVIRRYFALSRHLDGYLGKPLKAKDLPVRMLLLSGLNELGFMSTAGYAVVDESVKACDEIGRPWAKGLVNAILRRALRQRDDISATALSQEAEFNHPQWLIDAIRHDWPHDWQTILSNNNTHAPMTLRINSRRTTRATYLALLRASGIGAAESVYASGGLTLDIPQPVPALPDFAGGAISVQDEAAQLAAPLLDCKPGQRVLDACAAPGGKTAHLLELCPGVELLALDISARRIIETEENLDRLGHRCVTRQIDARTFAQTYASDAPRFERILLDAPCSAVGVIRRHPDIKLRRKAEDIGQAAERQQELLAALWPLLAERGRLLYVTCSILRAENDTVIDCFMASVSGPATIIPIEAAWGVATRYGRQTLPGQNSMDGFFFALLEKTATD